jgi:hypothetical protein
MKENQEKYNASDFARYHSGTMPPDEMHALEKAALEDPFLADALDGYAFSKKPEKELDEIRIQLDEKRKQKRAFNIFALSSGAWWRIAAMFIVIAGAGYFFFFINSQKENSLSVKENFAKKEKAEIISRLKDDTSAKEADIAFEKPLAKKNKTNRARSSSPAAKSIQIPPVKNIEEEKEIKEEKDLSEKHLAGENEKAIVMNNYKEKPVGIPLTDSGEKSFSPSPDVTAMVAPSRSEYLKDSDNMVAMNKAEPSLKEVVVVGYGTQRKKSMTGSVSKKSEGNADGVEASSASPYPKEGKEKFDQYIKDNSTILLGTDGKKLTADLLLAFCLNKKGNPVDIKVLESSCKQCETEAIRLLKEGPKWVGKPGEKGTVRIKF